MWRLVVVVALVACGHREPAPAPADPPRNVAPPDAAIAPVVVAPPDPAVAPADGRLVEERVSAVYSRQVSGCYKKQLKQDPTLHGKLALRFVIDGRGRVVEAHAAGIADALDRCVENAVSYWLFDPPQSGDETQFELTFNLVAN